MKRTKVFGILFCIFLITALFTLTASAYELSCDVCIASQETPTGHCSYYCTGDVVQQCTCGGDYKIWCGETHKFNTLVQSVTGTDCKTKGTLTYSCACGLTVTTNNGPVGGHAWGTGVLDAETGKIKSTCTLCGETKLEDPPSGGGTVTPDNPDPDDPDNPSGGGETPTDPDDPDNPSGGGETPTDPDDPNGGGTTGDPSCSHQYLVSVIDPTCEKQGYTLHTCRKCSYSYKDNYVAALGHDSATSHVQPTCTQTGLQTTYCQRDECQKILGQFVVAAWGHNFVNGVCTRCGFTNNCAHTFIEKVYAPTCHDFGYTLYTCTKCEYAYHGNYTTQLSHVWKMENRSAATCEKDGYEEYSCTRCGECDVKTLNATGHKWDAVSSSSAENGTTDVTYLCSVCNKTKIENLPTAAAQAQNWLLTSIRGFSQALIDMYETVANGVEVGGVTAGEVISGCVIIAAVLFLIAFALGNKG